MIGLVGGIGSGKSAVAARLETLGAFVIDADKVGHALLGQRPVRERVVEKFGPQILDPNVPEGEEPVIDRRALGAIVFADPAARKALEAIVHPRMRHTFEKAIARVTRQGVAAAVVLDAAILYEAGWDKLCDLVRFVDAPRDVRLARLASQRGWDEATLTTREKAQWALVEKRGRADAEVSNADDPEALGPAVDRAWSDLLSKAPARGRASEGGRPAGPGGPDRPGPPRAADLAARAALRAGRRALTQITCLAVVRGRPPRLTCRNPPRERTARPDGSRAPKGPTPGDFSAEGLAPSPLVAGRHGASSVSD